MVRSDGEYFKKGLSDSGCKNLYILRKGNNLLKLNYKLIKYNKIQKKKNSSQLNKNKTIKILNFKLL